MNPATIQYVHETGRLRSRIIRSLQKQGFRVRAGLIAPPDGRDKSKLRALHQEAVKHNVERSRSGLERHESRLLSYVAAGRDVAPERIRPRLTLVQRGSEDELLFRYTRLHWSIPVSAGYGRRLRFVIHDESNGKLIGIFGLGDPVFGLKPRDRWVGWDYEARRKRLQCVMDLFVLGAVPPYSHLLCGKLVALLATSREVQEAFRRKYGGRQATISRRPLDGRLALLTTTSALGRSSLYNRLRYGERPVFRSVGFTRGSGDFHFSNGFYGDLRKFALEHCDATAKHPSWGEGFRNRRSWCERRCRFWDCRASCRITGSSARFSWRRWPPTRRNSSAATTRDCNPTAGPRASSSNGSGIGGSCLARLATSATGPSSPRATGSGDRRDPGSLVRRFGSIRRSPRGARR